MSDVEAFKTLLAEVLPQDAQIRAFTNATLPDLKSEIGAQKTAELYLYCATKVNNYWGIGSKALIELLHHAPYHGQKIVNVAVTMKWITHDDRIVLEQHRLHISTTVTAVIEEQKAIHEAAISRQQQDERRARKWFMGLIAVLMIIIAGTWWTVPDPVPAVIISDVPRDVCPRTVSIPPLDKLACAPCPEADAPADPAKVVEDEQKAGEDEQGGPTSINPPTTTSAPTKPPRHDKKLDPSASPTESSGAEIPDEAPAPECFARDDAIDSLVKSLRSDTKCGIFFQNATPYPIRGEVVCPGSEGPCILALKPDVKSLTTDCFAEKLPLYRRRVCPGAGVSGPFSFELKP